MYPEGDRGYERKVAVAEVHLGAVDGPLVAKVTLPVLVGKVAVSDYSITDPVAVNQGGTVNLTASWTDPPPFNGYSMVSRWEYTLTGVSSTTNIINHNFFNAQQTVATYPLNSQRTDTFSLPIPNPCACELTITHRLLQNGNLTQELAANTFTVPINFTKATVTNVTIDGSGTDPALATSTSLATISFTDPNLEALTQYEVWVNNQPVTTTVNGGNLRVAISALGLSPAQLDGQVVPLSWQVRSKSDGSWVRSNVFQQDVQFRPANSARTAASPLGFFAGQTRPIVVSGTTLNPLASDDLLPNAVNPFGTFDCGAIWYQVFGQSTGKIRIDTAGSSSASGGVQELAVAVYDLSGNLVTQLLDTNRGTSLYPQTLTFDTVAGVQYLVAVAASDMPVGCAEDPAHSGPVVLSFTPVDAPPVQDTYPLVGFFAPLAGTTQPVWAEDIGPLLGNPTTDTELTFATFNAGADAAATLAPGFASCFDDPLDQTVWYMFTSSSAVPDGYAYDVTAIETTGDVQAAVFKVQLASNLTTILNSQLLDCSEDAELSPGFTGDTPPPPVVSFDKQPIDTTAGYRYMVMFDTNGRQPANITPIITGRASSFLKPIPLTLGAPPQTHSMAQASSLLGYHRLPCSGTTEYTHNTWFTWTAPSDEPADIGLAGFGALAVVPFQDDLDIDQVIACSATPGSQPETLRLNPTAGETYYIVAASESGEDGTFEIDITPRADKQVNDVRIPASEFPYRGLISNVGATTSGTFEDQATCAGTDLEGAPTGTSSVWYGFDMPADLDVDIDTFGSSIDTRLVVSNIAQEVGCNDDVAFASGQLSSRVRVHVPITTGGSGSFADQYIRIDGFGSAQGAIRLNLTTRGDDARNAVDLGKSINLPNTLNTRFATVEPEERRGDCHFNGDAANATVWWKWTSPAAGFYSLAATGFDTQLTVYSGADAPGPIVGCSDDDGPNFSALTQIAPTAADQVFWIQVDGYAAATGDATLTVQSLGDDPDFDGHPYPDDNCPFTDNPSQIDTDGDHVGNACDTDDDNDAVRDGVDNCEFDPNFDQLNTDGDAQGDTCDPDDDNDTVVDATDNCPVNSNTDQANADGDAQGDTCDPDDDNDGVPDTGDNCRTVPNPDQTNTDGGSSGDACDLDDDNDGVVDLGDNCRTVPNPDQTNTDGGNSGDACDLDDDNDGVPDAGDNCPIVVNADQADSDHDGLGDACDPSSPTPSAFASLAPARFADTRPGERTVDDRFVGAGRITGTYEIQVAGRGNVPADATAAIANLTIVGAAGPGFATAYPCGTLPNASSINYGPGSVDPNEIVVKLSPTGSVCVFTLATADILFDVVGYTGPTSPYQPLAPARYADTRPGEHTFDDRFAGAGILAGPTIYEIEIAGRGGVPDDAAAVIANVTTTGASQPGFATVFPCGTPPGASSLNYAPGVTRPNEIIAKLSPTGQLCVFALSKVHVIVDIVGFIPPGAGYTPLTPTRYADTRPSERTFDEQAAGHGIITGGSFYEIQIAGRGAIPSTATTAVINLTVTGTTGAGFATAYPCGTIPGASSLNYTSGTTRPNELITKLSPTGTICIFTLANAHLIVDVVGYT